MNKVLIFAYSFVGFMAIICAILIYLLTKKPEPQCFHDPCEYQLTIENEYIVIEDYGRNVTILPLDSTCNLGEILIEDNQ